MLRCRFLTLVVHPLSLSLNGRALLANYLRQSDPLFVGVDRMAELGLLNMLVLL